MIWTEHYFCIISDFRNYFKKNVKIYEETKNFFNPANTHSSSEETLKEKRYKFIDMCSLFTWFNMEILNVCHR